MNNSKVFECLNLSVCYEENFVVKDVSLSIDDGGKMIAIIGPNGAGKSSFIKSCLGILKKHCGEVLFWGKPFSKVRNKVSYIPQRSSIDFSFPIKVKDVVMMGIYGKLGLLKRPSKDDILRSESIMEDLGIFSQANSSILNLSGGQQQRVLVARSLMQKADFYFLDEPFVGLDSFSFNKIMSILKQICIDGKTVVVVHHDLNSIRNYFDKLIMLNRRLIAFGDVEEVFTDKNISFLYGGFHRIIQEAEKVCSDLSKGLD